MLRSIWPTSPSESSRTRPTASTRGVEADVEDGPARAGGEGDAVGPGGEADGAGPEPVEAAADDRREAEGQRHRARAESEDLPQQRPDDDLLEDDRLGPPIADVAEPADPRGGQGDDEEGADGEDDELEEVEEVDPVRGAEPVDRPVLADRLQPGSDRAWPSTRRGRTEAGWVGASPSSREPYIAEKPAGPAGDRPKSNPEVNPQTLALPRPVSGPDPGPRRWRYSDQPRGCGGTGRRAGFRCLCPSGRGGSTPLSRIGIDGGIARVEVEMAWLESRAGHIRAAIV